MGERTMFEGMTPEKLRTIADWFDTYDAIIEQVIFTLDGEEATDGKALIAVRGKEVQDDLRRWADDIETWERQQADHATPDAPTQVGTTGRREDDRG